MEIELAVMPQMMLAAFNRSRLFFEQEMQIPVLDSNYASNAMDALQLHDISAIVGVGGPVNLLLTFSFEKALLNELTHRFADPIEVPIEKRAYYWRETASEIVNIIAGHCTIDLQRPDAEITLTPPIIIEGVKNVLRPPGAEFSSLSLKTKYGWADINFVGPRDLFDDALGCLG